MNPSEKKAMNVLVTGASRGLGRGIALELARAGCSVAIHFGGNRKAAEETAATCAGQAGGGGQCFPLVQADLADDAQRRSLVPAALEALGSIEGFVSNAGIAPPERKDIAEAGEPSFDVVMDVNLKAPYFLVQQIAQHWLSRGAGDAPPTGFKLVIVSSISATAASLNRGEYCISKAGLAMATRLWALRLAGLAQVVELRPGIMETDMTSAVHAKYDGLIQEGQVVPMKRWGTPEDVGRAVRSILANDWPFTTGDAIYIDGGFHLEKL